MGAPEMPNEGAEGREQQGEQSTRSDTDTRSEHERSTTDTDETFYMDEAPSEERDAYYTSTTGEDTGEGEEGPGSAG